MTHRAWCFTLNNPETNDIAWPDCVRYAIWQRESGEAGTHHLQGYVELRKPARLSGVRDLVPRAHWEPRRGTRDQARDYCRKQDTRVDGPWEHGDFGAGGAGSRTDLSAVQARLDAGATEAEVAEEHFGAWCRYHKAFREYRRLRSAPRCVQPAVEVYWGDPGTGKSRRARSENEGAYWKPRSNWWDGYDGQEAVIIDDFYGWLPFDFMLRLLDRYPFSVEIKGGSVNFAATKIVITSNKHPENWYSNENCVFAALERRITKIVHFVKRADGTVETEVTRDVPVSNDE